MPMPPSPQCTLFDDQFSPPKSIPIHIIRDRESSIEDHQGWPYHSFSAPCPTAGHLEEIFEQHHHHPYGDGHYHKQFLNAFQNSSLHCTGNKFVWEIKKGEFK
jgi:hypothetical protein